MKLWILRPVGYPEDESDIWTPWYDKTFGFVICAETEEEARRMANERGGAETKSGNPWLDPNQTTCIELLSERKSRIIIQDYHYA